VKAGNRVIMECYVPKEEIGMAGKIKKEIEFILLTNAKGDKTLESITRTKLILRGINPSKFTDVSDDDEQVLRKLQELKRELKL